MEPTTVRGMIAGVGTAAAAVLFSATNFPPDPSPGDLCLKPIVCYSLQADERLCDFYSLPSDDRYDYFVSEDIQLEEQLSIIGGFSKHLIENSRDIEPEIVALVDEHFWDLI